MSLHIELPEDMHGELIELLNDAVQRNEAEAAALASLADAYPAAKDRAAERLEKAGSADALIHLLAKY